ncbi:7-deoxyloganetic acid glucosyltransferase-like [Panicum miliaceum]|uniref:7-deoxyloganetic acid glucosyltransferase-like n=1 Tax=Panicum miliaceum TaxID=4540 RepID=A0A3L6TAP3_PANMI|nr:7-deoxyloganetic acid glucosyltransferase-like [Panicum miliaceum]
MAGGARRPRRAGAWRSGNGEPLAATRSPKLCRRPNETDDVDPALHALATLSADSGKARALILNTTASLEPRSAEALAQQVKRDVAAGGSLATEFQRLVGFIRELGTSIATSGLSQW